MTPARLPLLLRRTWWAVALPLAALGVPLGVLRNGLLGTALMLGLFLLLATTAAVIVTAGNQPGSFSEHLRQAGPRALGVAPVVCFATTALAVLLGQLSVLAIVPVVVGGVWVLLSSGRHTTPVRRVADPSDAEALLRAKPSRMSTDEILRVLRAGAAAVRRAKDPVVLDWMAERRRRLLDELERREPDALRLLLEPDRAPRREGEDPLAA